MKKPVSVLLVLAVVALGAMHGHYTFLHSTEQIAQDVGFFAYLFGNYKRIDPSVARKKKDETSQKSSTDRETVPLKPLSDRRKVKPTQRKKTVVEKIKRPRRTADIRKVPQLLEEGKKLYMTSEYESAKKRFDEIVTILTETDRQSAPEYRQACNYSKRCHVFGALAGSIPHLELSDGRGLYEIDLDIGKTIVARVLRDDGDRVKIQQNGGIESEFTSDQIDDMRKLSPDAYRRMLKKEYSGRRAKADFKADFDIFGLALYAIQNKLREQITPVLEETFALPGSERVLETFYPGSDVEELVIALLESFDKEEAAEQYRLQHQLAQAPLEPDNPLPEPREEHHEPVPEPADLGREEVEPVDVRPQPFIEPERTPPARRGPYAAKLDEASIYFGTGQKFASEATRNIAKRFHYGKKAQKKLEKATDILNDLLARYPENQEIENLLHQVSDLLQFVVHNLVPVR